MRRYVFHSQLTAEEFCHLLRHRAEQRTGGRILAEVSGDEIRLMDCGALQIYGQVPFVGRVSAEEKGCVVTGGFPLSAVLSGKWLLMLWLLAVLVGCLFGVPLWLMAFFAAAWLVLSIVLVALINLCMRKRRRRVLLFLEQEMKQ